MYVPIMMKVLTSTEVLGLPIDAPTHDILTAFRAEFINAFNSPEGQLRHLGCWLPSGIMLCTTGATQPNRLRTTATRWNNDITFRVTRACEMAINQQLFASDLDNENTQTLCRNLERAAGAALNKFHPAEPGVYLNNECGIPYWHTLLTPNDLKDIKTNPQRYVIIEGKLLQHPSHTD